VSSETSPGWLHNSLCRRHKLDIATTMKSSKNIRTCNVRHIITQSADNLSLCAITLEKIFQRACHVRQAFYWTPPTPLLLGTSLAKRADQQKFGRQLLTEPNFLFRKPQHYTTKKRLAIFVIYIVFEAYFWWLKYCLSSLYIYLVQYTNDKLANLLLFASQPACRRLSQTRRSVKHLYVIEIARYAVL
jgi:hypothetical protein